MPPPRRPAGIVGCAHRGCAHYPGADFVSDLGTDFVSDLGADQGSHRSADLDTCQPARAAWRPALDGGVRL